MPSPAVRRILLGATVPAWAVIRPLLTELNMRPGVGAITNTRATTATIADWEGVIKTVLSGESRHGGARRVQNLIPTSSENLTLLDAAATKANSSVTATQITLNTVNASYWYAKTALSQSWSGRKVVCRVDVTSAVSRTVLIRISGSTDATGSTGANVALTAGVPKTISVTASGFNTTVQMMAFGFDNTSGNGASDTSAGTITFTNLQLEDVTGQSNQNPGEYVSVGVLSAPFHGLSVDGAKDFATLNGNTVASNVVTEATGAAISSSTLLGYLIDPAATNLCLQSADFATTWATSNVTVSTNTTTAPDGTATADLITPTVAAATTHRTFQTITLSAVAHILTVYIKPNGYTKFGIREVSVAGYYATFNTATSAVLDSGAGGTGAITALANGWYRVSLAFTATAGANIFSLYPLDAAYTTGSPTAYTYTADGTSGVYQWGAQLETGSVATSYIPTTTVAVSKNKDLDSILSANNLGTTNQTIYDEWTPAVTSGTQYVWGTYVDASNYTILLHDGTSFIFRKRIGGVNYDASKTQALTAGTTYRLAARHSTVTGTDIFVNGNIGTNNADVNAMQVGTSIQLATDGNGTVVAPAYHRHYRIANAALSNSAIGSIA